jgi:hypothetical protein
VRWTAVADMATGRVRFHEPAQQVNVDILFEQADGRRFAMTSGPCPIVTMPGGSPELGAVLGWSEPTVFHMAKGDALELRFSNHGHDAWVDVSMYTSRRLEPYQIQSRRALRRMQRTMALAAVKWERLMTRRAAE